MDQVLIRKNPCYCINLRQAANSITRYYDNVFKNLGITVTQFSLLNEIKYFGICSKSQLSEQAQLDKSTITRNLLVLKRKGFIEDIADEDSRESKIMLTCVGIKKIEEGMSFWNEAQTHFEKKIGKEKMKELRKILNLLINEG